MTYIFYVVLDIMANIIAYITNPIVVLFADERGNLPRFLRWWQTHDNPLDIEWMISEGNVPSFAKYDFNKHYKYVPEWDAEKETGTRKGYVILLDDKFTLKERIQRYICRLCWLYRNTAYTFGYEVCGKTVLRENTRILKNERRCDYWYFKAKDDTGTWSLYYVNRWCKWFYLRVYLGWKMTGILSYDKLRCMLAVYVNPFRIVK